MYAVTAITMGTVLFVTPALVRIGADLRASQTQVQFIADALPVLLAGMLLPAGATLDRYGRRRGMIAGLGVIAISLIASGFAASADLLVLLRALAGVGAAFVFPGTLSTITSVTGPESRTRGVALWSGACMAGGLSSLLFAGCLTEFAGRRGLFLGMALIVLAGLSVVVMLVPETRSSGQPLPDLLLSLLALMGVGGLSAGIVDIPVGGPGSIGVWAPLSLGPIGIGGFLRRSLRSANPLIDLRTLANPDVAFGFGTIFALFVCSQAWFFLGFQYNAYVFGWSPLAAAAGIAPAGLTIVPCSVIGARFAATLGARRLCLLGLTGLSIACALLGWAGASLRFPLVVLATVVWGVGVGLPQAPATQMIVNAIPRAQQGVASALNDLAREMGAAFGIAIIGTAFNAGYRHSIRTHVSALAVRPVLVSPAAGLLRAHHLGSVALQRSVRASVGHGWEVAMVAAGCVVLVLVFGLAAVLRSGGGVVVRERAVHSEHS